MAPDMTSPGVSPLRDAVFQEARHVHDAILLARFPTRENMILEILQASWPHGRNGPRQQKGPARTAPDRPCGGGAAGTAQPSMASTARSAISRASGSSFAASSPAALPARTRSLMPRKITEKRNRAKAMWNGFSSEVGRACL